METHSAADLHCTTLGEARALERRRFARVQVGAGAQQRSRALNGEHLEVLEWRPFTA